ncbi:MAG: hypothetical protein WC761_05005 [Candidatus Paceibacterota bacterium]|jgi:homoserine dehydrogenase
MVKAIVIGSGSVGSELCAQLKSLGWEIIAIVKSREIVSNEGEIIETDWQSLTADVVFVSIPTDGGEKALQYIEHFLKRNIPVVTCEKGALAYHFDTLKPYIKNLGFNATVGGGTQMISYLKGRVPEKIDSLCGVLNGTLNFIFSKLGEGKTSSEVLKEILEKKYAEPGANTFEEIVAGELGDLHKKGIMLANVSGLLKQSLKPTKDFVIEKDILDKAINSPKKYRFLFSMSRTRQGSFVAGVHYEADGFYIEMGLYDVSGFDLKLPEGVDNGFFIQEGESLYSITGPGAGPVPTALAMIADAARLI